MASWFITIFAAFMSALNTVTNVVKAFWKTPGRVTIRNLGIKEQLNLLEITNTGGRDIKNVHIFFPKDQEINSSCYWENLSLGEPLIIENLPAGDHQIYPFMFGYFGEGGNITFKVMWGKKQNKQNKINVHLFSVDGCY